MFDLQPFHAVLFDMDGVLYRGSQPLPGVSDLLRFLDSREIRYACVTNNATMTPQQFEAKLAKMNVSMPASQIVTSPLVTRRYLETQLPAGSTIYCIGMTGLREALFSDGYFVERDDHVDAVVVGMNFEVTFRELRKATLLIRAGARFVGTNPDKSFPAEDGIIPGCGALLALLETATDVKPFVIGKPGPTMMHAAVAMLAADPQRTLTIGDRLDTDIAGARAAGLAAALVLTGVATRDDLVHENHPPDVVFDDLPALLAAWQQA